MINSELARLAVRRERLVVRSATQREVLTRGMASWRPRLVLVDRGIAAVRYVRRYPALLAAAGLLLAALRPRRAVGWLQRGWVLWQIGSGLLNRRRL